MIRILNIHFADWQTRNIVHKIFDIREFARYKIYNGRVVLSSVRNFLLFILTVFPTVAKDK